VQAQSETGKGLIKVFKSSKQPNRKKIALKTGPHSTVQVELSSATSASPPPIISAT